jgi:very-short-patch-repair endonuclease
MTLTYILAGVAVVLFIGAVLVVIVFGSKEKKEIPLPYRAKKYFFTKTEQEFVRILNELLDRQKYTIFPKVRLADIVEVTVTGQEYQAWWNKIKSKHVDFLLWNVQEGKVALVIELDGKSHGSEKMIERDDFVNRLYEQVGIKLIRVNVGTDFKQEIGKILGGLKMV